MKQYLDIDEALGRAKERSGATTADDDYLTELLELSAGVDAEAVTHFRPFIVAAKWLEQNRSQQALSEADGVKFTGQSKPIASLLSLQAAYDSANALVVPAGFEAAAPSSAGQQRFRSRSLARIPTP